MDLLDLLPREHIVAPLQAGSLREAVLTLVRRLQEQGVVNGDSLSQRIRTEPLREVVAISDDVVLPHYRTEDVDGLTVALGISADRIPAAEPGVEARPRLVALILAPPEAATLYLQTTSTLARLLRRPGVVDRMVAADGPDAVLALEELRGLRIQPSLTARDVMQHRFLSVGPDATVRSTLDVMLRRRLHAVAVVGEKGEVLGMVTDADIMRALLPQIPRAVDQDRNGKEPGPSGDRSVRDIMTRSVLCVSEDLGVNEVASMMINKDVEQVPVVHEGTITGMVTRTDIIRKLFGRA